MNRMIPGLCRRYLGYMLTCCLIFSWGCGALEEFGENAALEQDIVFSIRMKDVSSHSRMLGRLEGDLQAEITVDNGSPSSMSIDFQTGKASARISGIGGGEHEFSVRFFQGDLTLAKGKVIAPVRSGAVNKIEIRSFDTNFDEDEDGFTNLSELLADCDTAACDPANAESFPPFDLPPTMSLSDSGMASSGSISVSAGIGGYLPPGKSKSVDGIEIYSLFQ